MSVKFDMKNCAMQGRVISADVLGELREHDVSQLDSIDVSQEMSEHGYMFLRGVHSTESIQLARSEVFGRLYEVGEVASPDASGIFTGTSNRESSVSDLGEFWQSVSEGEALRAVTHGEQIQSVMDSVFSRRSKAHDYLFLRPGVAGRSTHLHYDKPFFARGSDTIYTVWTALGDIPVELGPLVVVEGSQGFTDLVAAAFAVDYESSDTPLVQVMQHPEELARARGVRLLTADFRAGDVIVFSMSVLHGSLDNVNRRGEIRLSSDVRWQPASDPVDPRYMGPNPPGTTGAGYGELNGAKPLTAPWHKR